MKQANDILSELEALSPTLAAIPKSNVYTVPAGYFEWLSADIVTGIKLEAGAEVIPGNEKQEEIPQGYFNTLAGNILEKIHAQENEDATPELLSPLLQQVQSVQVYSVPDGYFENLTAEILQKTVNASDADAAGEIRGLSPMLYSIQNENVYTVPAGYFDAVAEEVLNKVKPEVKVVNMRSRTGTFFKYAVAAAFTGMMALGVFKFTGNQTDDVVLPDYVNVGLQIQNVDQVLETIPDADIKKYLESTGMDVQAALVANSIDKNELPAQEDYLLDDEALDNYLNSINVDDLKN